MRFDSHANQFPKLKSVSRQRDLCFFEPFLVYSLAVQAEIELNPRFMCTEIKQMNK